jgi:plastocyanin
MSPGGSPHVHVGRTFRGQWAAFALAAACSGLACALVPFAPIQPATGGVSGRVVSGDGTPPGQWVVVYLEGPALDAAPAASAQVARLRSREGGLAPVVLAVSAGQSVTLASDDGLHHRFFSSSRPQGFEPIDVPGGKSRRLSLARSGIVRVYCSLHPNERSTIVVAPSRHFSTLRAPGGYALRDVPPGKYALHAWSELHRDQARPVQVPPGESTVVEIELGADQDS